MIVVRLVLVFAVLLGPLPCGSAVRVAATADPAPPVTGKRCQCCKRDKARPTDAPKPLPAKPTCPPDCPCAVCSPGYAPLSVIADPPQLIDPAGDYLPDLVPSDAPTGYRPPLDRPPRAAS
jgi:hypothetical protein